MAFKMTAATALFIGLTTAPTVAMALPNPAAKYCLSLGGRSEITRDKNGGERGWCLLPNGQRVDEWALFRASHRRP